MKSGESGLKYAGRMTLVTTQIDGPLATITIDSPPLNLFEAQMIGELSKAIEDLHADPPRALLIQAKGEVVSGGVNVEEFKGLNPSQGSALWSDLLGLIDRVESLPLPVVFRAHGLTLRKRELLKKLNAPCGGAPPLSDIIFRPGEASLPTKKHGPNAF